MRAITNFALAFLALANACVLSAQDQKAANPAAAPPNVLLLVHQEFPLGKAAERQRLESSISRASDRLETPSYWIDLESLTGTHESLSFDPFESFEQIEEAKDGWSQFFAVHPDLAQMQEQVKGLVYNERPIVAVRRDDLGYLSESIDLSEAHYMRVLEVRLFPGHEGDFAEAARTLADAFAKIQADTPWVVYQVDVGMPAPAFLVFMPLPELKRNDDLLTLRENLLAAEGEQAADNLRRIAREGFASTETNLYSVSPETSHVSKDFAAGDPGFWKPKSGPEQKPETKPADVKPPDTKPKPKPSVSR